MAGCLARSPTPVKPTPLDGLDLNELDVYVGVSSGGFVAAALANGI